MNLSFDINTREGDIIIVSLSSSYAYLKELLPDQSEAFEVLEVSLIRKAGDNPIKMEVFGKIADILLSIAEENPHTILFYFCDIVEGIPRLRTGKGIQAHKYRNELFKLLFARYCKRAQEHWSDIEVILKSTDPFLEMYAHFLVRDKHLTLIDLLKAEVQNNFQAISDQK